VVLLSDAAHAVTSWVLVVREGQITADIARDEATPENVMFAATRTHEVTA
jgi:rhamnose transport system ATP-binding protein